MYVLEMENVSAILGNVLHVTADVVDGLTSVGET